MAHLFIKKFFLALAAFASYSAHADLQKSVSSQQLANENLTNQKIEILDYDIARDFEAVKNIVKEGWDTLSSSPYDEELIHKSFIQNISSNRAGEKTIIKVARVDGQTAGVMTFVPGDYGMVELLAVDSKFRNKGLGFKLLSAAQELAQKSNAQGLELYVFNHNTPAIKLYEKFGLRYGGFAGKIVSLMDKSFALEEAKQIFLSSTTPTIA